MKYTAIFYKPDGQDWVLLEFADNADDGKKALDSWRRNGSGEFGLFSFRIYKDPRYEWIGSSRKLCRESVYGMKNLEQPCPAKS